jgi:inosine-uridine nucleoside N-ribohydrolase
MSKMNIKNYIYSSLLILALSNFISCNNKTKTAETPVKIIFDTDFGGDADDLGALAMLHNFHKHGECELLAVMLWGTEQYAVPAVDALNHYYGNQEVLIGTRSRNTHRAEWQHTKPIADAFPHELTVDDVPLAVDLYRKILAEQADNSVVIITTGPLANIMNLLQSNPDSYSPLSGKELIEKKVKYFSIMGGMFPEGKNEWNFNGDMPGVTRYVLDHLTVPIVFSGFEIGVRIKTGPRFEADKNSPLYIGYKHFSKHAPWMVEYYQEGQITPNSTYDQTSVLYVVTGGVGEYWNKVENGLCRADDFGGNTWEEVNDHPTNHAYLVLIEKPEKMADIIYAFMMGDAFQKSVKH